MQWWWIVSLAGAFGKPGTASRTGEGLRSLPVVGVLPLLPLLISQFDDPEIIKPDPVLGVGRTIVALYADPVISW